MSSIFFKVLPVSFASGLIVYKVWQKVYSPQTRTDETAEILFFPDTEVACRQHFTSRHGCHYPRCRFSHNENLAYAKLLKILTSARKSIDLCVFCLTCKDLCDVLVDSFNKGVAIRIITDSEQSSATGSQLGFLRSKGIQVRCDNTSYFMHHKFLIIDGSILINGSFNWTRQAITGNFENLMVLKNKTVSIQYNNEFNKLWNLFDPSR